jgi:hypothetical protein
VPAPLKRLLLPVWNGGHRLAWRIGEVIGAVRHRRWEWCSVCGWFGPMLYRRWVIPPKLEQLWGLSPAVADALARKESLDCFWCGAKLRARRLALAVLETIPVKDPPRCRSLREWVKSPVAQQLRVAEINIIEGVHEELCTLRECAYSEFREGDAPGSTVNGVRAEDLTRLTYEDGSFHLVLTSETLEHVPDFDLALREIFRVLKPGGWHIFTVPLLPGVETTFARAEVDASGGVVHRATPICHPGGDAGYPVFTEFGADFLEILQRAGFEADVLFGPVSERDVAQVYRCRKSGVIESPARAF